MILSDGLWSGIMSIPCQNMNWYDCSIPKNTASNSPSIWAQSLWAWQALIENAMCQWLCSNCAPKSPPEASGCNYRCSTGISGLTACLYSSVFFQMILHFDVLVVISWFFTCSSVSQTSDKKMQNVEKLPSAPVYLQIFPWRLSVPEDLFRDVEELESDDCRKNICS